MAKEAEALAAQAERLTELKRMARGVTFKDIAEVVGRTERQVQRWFAGDSDIDGAVLTKLADFLGTTADYIEYGTIKRSRTPEPFEANGEVPSLLAIQKQLAAIQDQLEALRIDTEARDLAMMQRLDEELLPRMASQ